MPVHSQAVRGAFRKLSDQLDAGYPKTDLSVHFIVVDRNKRVNHLIVFIAQPIGSMFAVLVGVAVIDLFPPS